MTALTMELPDFQTMDDEAVHRHVLARGRDGRWSRQTRALLERFGTTKLNLNEAWALTWEGWTCPCCNRSKAHIARANAGGVLLCQLDEHHDHLHEAASAILRAELAPDLPDEIRTMRATARRLVYPLVERFEAILLCADCNQADAKMKARLGDDVPRHFSFSPTEIATFILPVPGQPHAIDIDQGNEAWNLARPVYEDRLAFARLMAGRLAAGQHDRQPALARLDVGDRVTRSIYRLVDSAADPRTSRTLFSLEVDLLHRSRAADGNASALRKSRRPAIAPSDAEYARIEAAMAESPNWVLAGDVWACPICERTKRAICRKSNKGKWHAMIMRIGGFWEEADPTSRDWRTETFYAPLILAGREEYLVCQDCRHLATIAVTVVPGTDSDCFSVSDLKRLVAAPEPNRSHDVTQDAIRDAVAGNAEWLAAVADLASHSIEARAIDGEISRLVTFAGYDHTLARLKVLNDYAERRPSFDQDYEARFDWLAAEGARFHAIGSAPMIEPAGLL